MLEMTPSAVTKVVLHTDRFKAEAEMRQFLDQYS